MQTFIDQVAQLESKLDDVVNHGSDEQLFIASYLQGHVAVVAKPMEIEATADLQQLDSALMTSLNQAFENKELEPEDQAKVLSLWRELKDSVSQC